MNWSETRARLVECGVDVATLPKKWQYRIDLSGIDLRGVDLSEANLRGVILRRACLSESDLSGVSLREADLRGSNLRGAILHKAYLSDSDLSGANLREADLRGADLCRSDLSEAVLRNANLSETNLYRASLRAAYLPEANLREAYLQDADLREACLRKAILSGADLRGVNLQAADLRGANLQSVKINYLTIGIHPAPKGVLIGWGKKDHRIVKLLISAGARRSCATTRKYRAEYIETLEIDGGANYLEHTTQYGVTIYAVGEITSADSWDKNRWNECSHGIHFFLTREEAEAWSP